jgi:hypothetical protein
VIQNFTSFQGGVGCAKYLPDDQCSGFVPSDLILSQEIINSHGHPCFVFCFVSFLNHSSILPFSWTFGSVRAFFALSAQQTVPLPPDSSFQFTETGMGSSQLYNICVLLHKGSCDSFGASDLGHDGRLFRQCCYDIQFANI